MLVLDSLAYIYLFLFSLYHLITGIVSVFFSNFAIKFYKKLYGFQPKETKQLKMTLKPWGSFAICVGFVGFIILLNIQKYFLFLIPFSILLVIRIGYRFTFRNELKNYWKVTEFQNWRMILIQVIGVLLFLLFTINRL
jgi:hypothetical protein